MPAVVYLIPSELVEGSKEPLPAYIIDAVKQCSIFFTENERTSRRFLKSLWKEMVIDQYTWYTIHKAEKEVQPAFLKHIRQGETIGILSEAGCPGVADPGQMLVSAAQKAGAVVKPLVGPSSLLLALMASGLNGQQFQFTGYLPIDAAERIKAIRVLENESLKKNCTQLFIETPYRNNQLLETLVKTCKPDTLLCIASELTSAAESIRTKMIVDWAKQLPDLHKKPVVFLMLAG